MSTFSPAQGIMLIAGYGLFCFLLAWFMNRRGAKGPESKATFLVAGRSIGPVPGALSIAASWIWAPALFVSSQKAYTQGLAGIFWFTAPNVLCLVLFAFFADRVRGMLPMGFTLSGLMRSLYSRRVHRVYLVQMGGLAVCSFAVQLLAGGKVLAHLSGLPFAWITLLLALVALSYSLFSGIRASIGTDMVQMGLIALVAVGAVLGVVHGAGGMDVVRAGLGGLDGQFASLFSGDGLDVALGFGLPVSIGLLAGPFGDQSFWQRAFSLRRDGVRSAFLGGALVFALVPISLSVLGFVAAGAQMQVEDPGLVNISVVERFLPAWALVPVLIMLLSGLVSTLDSNLCAISGLVGHDLDQGESLASARWSMLGLALGAVIIANIPGMKILYLFLFYGTLRAVTLLPTMATLALGAMSEVAVFWGMVAAICLGLPVFAWGNFNGELPYTIAGSLLSVLVPGASMVAAHMFGRYRAMELQG